MDNAAPSPPPQQQQWSTERARMTTLSLRQRATQILIESHLEDHRRLREAFLADLPPGLRGSVSRSLSLTANNAVDRLTSVEYLTQQRERRQLHRQRFIDWGGAFFAACVTFGWLLVLVYLCYYMYMGAKHYALVSATARLCGRRPSR